MNYVKPEQLLARLKQVFKNQNYKPDDDIKDILYKEGQLSVLRFIEKEFLNKGERS